jgi:methyl-accepting chemotaxis protein
MLKFRSIQITIAFFVALCLLVALGVVTGYSAITSRQSTLAAAEKSMGAEADARGNEIEMEMEVPLDAARTMAQLLATQIETNQSLTRAEVTALLKPVLEQNPTFFGVYTEWEPNAFDGKDAEFVGTENTDETGHFSPYWYREGDTIALTSLARLDETDSTYQYYAVPKQTKQEAVTDPYYYPLGNKQVLMTSFTAPIIVNDKFYGIAGVDMTLDFLQSLADQAVDFSPQAHLSIYSNAGTVSGFTGNPDLITKPISAVHADYEQDLSNIQAGKSYIETDEGNILAASPMMIGLYPQPWAVQFTLPISEVTAAATRDMWITIVIGIVLFLISLAVVYFISGAIAKPIKLVTRGAQLLAKGDANLKGIDQKEILGIVQRSDEIGAIGKAFQDLVAYFKEMSSKAESIANRDLSVSIAPKGEDDILGNTFVLMVAGLRDTIEKVLHNANSVSEASGQLASTSDQAGQATGQIATTIQQIATGTTQQSESVNHTASSVEEMARAIDGVAKGAQEQAEAAAKAASLTSQLSSTIDQVAGNAQAVVKDSSLAAEAARKGSKTVEQTLSGMRSIKEAVDLSASKVQEMGNRSNQIGDIVTAIEDIASQTNLLALNAAIEAARAGEAGKGFAVVADEVRKLADRSSSATKEIGDLIKGIQSTVAEAVKSMDVGAKQVEAGVASANEAGEALQEILKAADAVNEQAEQAAAAAEEMAASANELVSAVDSVSAVVEENTAATEQMAASSSEVTQSIESIASVSEENSASVEEVSASAEEMTAQVEEVSVAAKKLAHMSEELRQIVSQFKM